MSAPTTSAPAPPSDFRPSDYAVAIAVALAVQVGAAGAIAASSLERPAEAPEIDKGTAVPVKVVPVVDLDSPLLKLGGKKTSARLPDRWLKQAPKPRVEEKAFVSPKAAKTPDAIPPKEMKIADAGTEPPPPDAEVAKVVDTEITTPVDAGAPANVDIEGHQDGVKEGTETDPLKARAVDLYRARIAAWFSSRFRVSGSGLSQEELTALKVGATVELSPDRRVVSYSIVPSGNAAFDAAARATLEGAKGDTIPPPPENYPDTIQSRISVTFVCKENRCD
jgi:hypothetical protein